MSPINVTVALDWTPNTNHAGFYLAKHLGYYSEAGLDVSLLSPHEDEYKVTPASRLCDGTATFAVAPSESVISYHTWGANAGTKPKVRAVAALLQSSTSAIVTLASSGIDTPAKLDGKTYASYGARYEGRIVQQLVINGGGRGEFVESTPPMLGIWETLLKGEAHATWVFMGWEGVEAQLQGVELNAFRLEDYNVPYGYSPLLLAGPDTLRDQPAMLQSFLAATARAYQWAAKKPREAAVAFRQAMQAEHTDKPLPSLPSEDLLRESMLFTSPSFLTPGGRWGLMDQSRWDAFLDWLAERGLLTSKVQSRTPQPGVSSSLDGLRAGDVGEVLPREAVRAQDLFTNDFLP